MKTINLIYGTYNTQPVGASHEAMEEAYQNNYKPFLSILNKFPTVPIVLYYSGVLLEWIEKNHPEFIMLLSEMVRRKQVELLTGGFYEPIITLIPNTDRLGQIEKLTTYIRSRFGKRPRGNWLAERIWEQNLVYMLNTNGIEYTFLEDSCFEKTGLNSNETNNIYLTEDQGKTLIMFPLSEDFEKSIIIEQPEEIVKKIINLSDTSGEKVVVILTNGEEYGKNMELNNRHFKNGWIEDFIKKLIRKEEIIKIEHPGRLVKTIIPKKKIYFPCTSYRDMVRWALPTEMAKHFTIAKKKHKLNRNVECFIGGGFFRQFLSKYPESNYMHSKMIYTNILVNQIRGDKYKKKTAREELWKGQCNRAYWHGKYQGIYSNILRKNIYKSFIQAEKMTRNNGMFIPSIINVDFDMDGRKEYLYQDVDINAYVHLKGGTIFELDFIPEAWNYLDTFSRKEEVYHNNNSYVFDDYLRRTFIDHFHADKSTVFDFYKNNSNEIGDFVENKYELSSLDREHFELVLQRSGFITTDKKKYSIELEKKYRFSNTTIDVYYTIKNKSEQKIKIWFGSELNLSFASNSEKYLSMFSFDQEDKKQISVRPYSQDHVNKVALQDLYNNVLININSSNEFFLWSLPIETMSQCNGKMEKLYQSSCFMLRWRLELEPEEIWQCRIGLSFARM